MKILVVSHVHPHRKNIITDTYNNFFSSLRNRMEYDEAWLIFQPDKFESQGDQTRTIIDIHGFDDAVSLLKNIKPDCVFIAGLDRVQVSLNIAAKHLNIPVFTIFVYGIHYLGDTAKKSAISRLRWMLNSFFSDKVPSDTTEKKKFLRKGKFILYKLGFFYRTLRSMDESFVKALMIPCREILLIMLGKDSHYDRLPDYYFLPDDFAVSALVNDGISRESIFVTGNPFWDNFKIKRSLELEKIDSDGPIRVLVLTNSFYEHSYWSYKQRADFVTSLVSNLRKNPRLEISFKIHPSSEDREDYLDILRDYGNTIKIFQSENILDIIDDFDVAVASGVTTAQTEVIASGVRLVLVKVDPPLGYAKLVSNGISSGIVTVCESPVQIDGAISDCLKKDIEFSDDFVAERDKLFPKEKPSIKMAEIVARILSK